MIGKHFLCKAIDSKKVKRHYTITNCMDKDVYEEYMKAINTSTREVISKKSSVNKKSSIEYCDVEKI